MKRRGIFVIIVALLITMSGCMKLFGPKHFEVKGIVTYEDDGTPAAAVVVCLGELTQTTNSKGAFTFKDVGEGYYQISVLVDDQTVYAGFVEINKKVSPMVLNLEVPREPTYSLVNGSVKYFDGWPVLGATVRLGDQTVDTDASGLFTLGDVVYGTYLLTVSIDDVEQYSEEVVLQEEETVLDIVVVEEVPQTVNLDQAS